MGFDFLLSDDATAAAALVFGPTAAGATSATQTIHGWWNKGTPGGSISDLSFQLLVEDPGSPGTFRASGLAALDDHWLEARINGGANPSAASSFQNVTTDWHRLGSGTLLRVPDLPGNCAFYIELRLHPPLKEGSASETVTFKLNAIHNESAFPIGAGLPELGSGILTGVGDRTISEWVDAPAVTPTGTPDAVVHVGQRWYLSNGISLRTCATDDLTLNQNDGAAAALTTGKEYKALISQGPGSGTGDTAATVTKGVMAATGASVTPALPAGHLPIAVVTVAYHSGASVIGSGSINVLAKSGRGKPAAGTGLTITVGPFRAITPGALIRTTRVTTVSLTASSTNYVWIGAGGVTVSLSATPPFAGAVPLAKVVTGVSTVTSVTDLRNYFEPGAMFVRLKSLVAATGTSTFDAAAMPYAWNIDRVYARLGAAVAGTGSTEFNPKVSAGTSICPSGFRPTILHGTVAAEGYPNLTVGDADTFLGALAADTTPAATLIEVDLVVYPLARP